jgi:hypothetical protein
MELPLGNPTFTSTRGNAAYAHSVGRPGRSVREQLLARGVPAAHIRTHLLVKILPLSTRLWRQLDRLLGSDLFEQEDSLLYGVAEACSHTELIDVYHDYAIKVAHSRDPLWHWLAKPKLRRILKFYGQLRRSVAKPGAG